MNDKYIYSGKNTVYSTKKNSLMSIKSVKGYDIYIPKIFMQSGYTKKDVTGNLISLDGFVCNNFKIVHDVGEGFKIYYKDSKSGQICSYMIPFFGFSVHSGIIDIHIKNKMLWAELDSINKSTAYDNLSLKEEFGGYHYLRVGLINRLYLVEVISNVSGQKEVMLSLNGVFILFHGVFCFVIDSDNLTLLFVGVAHRMTGNYVAININNILYATNEDSVHSLRVALSKRMFLN